MNTELLLKVKAAILSEPNAFRMDTWSCGTAHCIAGWVLKLSGLRIANATAYPFDQRLEDGRLPDEAASALLEIEYDQFNLSPADNLFQSDMWPDDFADRHNNAESRQERAQIAAERIDHFIATDGRE